MKTVLYDDVIVTISHPHGNLEVTLNEWIQNGPGDRDLLQPISAHRISTGEKLPTKVIPLRYRNSHLSRLLISLNLIEKPWT